MFDCTSKSSDSSGVNAPLLNSDNISEVEERIVEPFTSTDPSYPPNIIITSRYNIFSFIPKSIFEQFRRLANVYFLVLGIIAAIGANTHFYDTAVEPAGLLIPMTIVVTISIIKDGIEDVKRHRADDRTNNRIARVVDSDGTVRTTEWKNIVVGSVLLLLGDDEVPADCVVVECGGIQGPTTYVETAAIDGETNLKIRLPSLPRVTSSGREGTGITVSTDKTRVSGLEDYRMVFHVELPNGSIHRFEGSMELYEVEDRHARSEYTLTEKNICLRGSIIRASEWAICVVVYTGRDTKLSLNSKSPPSKLSVVDGVVNRTLIIAISAMLIVCVFSAIASIVWEINNNEASYLCINEDDLEKRYNGGGCETGSTNSALTILTFATLFNNFVCISMYVSLEMIYLWQAFFISQDLSMYDSKSDSPAEAHTSGMCADLGQVQYVLSDKTGTLTKNVMKLRRCSVAGMIYGAPMDSSTNQDTSTVNTENKQTEKSAARTSKSFDSLVTDSGIWTPLTSLTRFKTLPDGTDRDLLLNFMRTLSVCNTVMLMPDQITGELHVTDRESLEACLEAESADEVALVIAAAEHSDVVLVKRDSDSARVLGLKGIRDSDATEVPGDNTAENFEILAVNEFDSNRKRMSVVVRIDGGNPVVLCKGADSAMFSVCVNGPYTTQCKEHVDEFASTGLRTLVMAKRTLSDAEFSEWLQKYKTAASSLSNRKDMLQRCAEELEVDMDLLGAVGIEDELQDGVYDAIETMNAAGLNLWMITGDKAETAIAIGQMCGLLRPEHELELLLKNSGDNLGQRLSDLVVYLERISAEHEQKKETPVPSRSVSSHVSKALKKAMAYLNAYDGNAPSERSHESSGGRAEIVSQPVSSHGLSTSLKNSKEETDSSSLYNRYRDSSGGDNIGSTVQPHPMSSRDKQRTLGERRVKGKFDHIALVVDGLTLEEIWRDKGLLQLFVKVARLVPTVVACRVSPLQKSSLVRMIKTGEGNPVTLAIGDGANDIGMIHEAKIGVGICGNEGRHAANSADFAIGQFRFLTPLLLKHGRYNYIRSSKLVLYSFFKNLVLVSALFYYQLYSGFSGTMPMESIVVSGFNFYLGLPIIAIGLMDKDVPYSSVLKFPRLAYMTGRNRELLNLSSMGRWCTLAFCEGLALFALAIRFVGGRTRNSMEDGRNIQGVGVNNAHGMAGGIYAEGFLLFCCVVIAMMYKVAAVTCTWTVIHAAFWLLSLAGYVLFVSVYSQFDEVYDWYKVVDFSFRQVGKSI